MKKEKKTIFNEYKNKATKLIGVDGKIIREEKKVRRMERIY